MAYRVNRFLRIVARNEKNQHLTSAGLKTNLLMCFFHVKMLLIGFISPKNYYKIKFMSQKQISKIQMLLEQAAKQKASETTEISSVECSTRVFNDVAESEKAFEKFRRKLFRINEWNRASEISSFYLYDENGLEQPDKNAAVSDFIKIILPGSGKSDWVKITEIYELPDEVVLTVQPSIDPTDAKNKHSTSHFFTGDSTNNFCLQKNAGKINFRVIGLNEKSNTTDTSGVLETIRNFATANIGSFLGIQKAQWQTFCDNFLEVSDKN